MVQAIKRAMTASMPRRVRSVSDKHADRFLWELVNRAWPTSSPDEKKQTFAWFLQHPVFNRLLPVPPEEPPRRTSEVTYRALFNMDEADRPTIWFGIWQYILQGVWAQPSERARRDSLAVFIAFYSAGRAGGRFFGEENAWRSLRAAARMATVVRLPSAFPVVAGFPDPFLEVLFRARDIAHRLGRCANPDCHTPFFIADRVTQKFCLPSCAASADRKRKRQWWKKHGSEWRRKRKAKRGSRKSQRKGGK